MPEARIDKRSTERPRGYFDEIGYDPDKMRTKKPDDKIEALRKVKGPVRKPVQKRKLSLRLIILIAGIVLLTASTLFAVSTMEPEQPRTLQDTDEYLLFKAVLSSDELNYEYGQGSSNFDAGKVMSADAESIRDLIIQSNGVFSDYQFVIEIVDISSYNSNYDRTLSEGNAIGSFSLPGDNSDAVVVTFETGVNIFVSSDEIHTAKMIMHIWKN